MSTKYTDFCKGKMRPSPHQCALADEFLKHADGFSTLAYMGLGTGKTIASVNVAEALFDKKRIKHIVLVTKKSLMSDKSGRTTDRESDGCNAS